VDDLCAGALPLPTRFARLERDDFSSNHPPAPALCLSMIFSENRFPLFGIMLQWMLSSAGQNAHRGRAPRLIVQRGVA
jgi:hypothetical protein